MKYRANVSFQCDVEGDSEAQAMSGLTYPLGPYNFPNLGGLEIRIWNPNPVQIGSDPAILENGTTKEASA